MVALHWASHSIAIQFNEIEGFYPSQISTGTNTPPTGNAQIVIQVEEGIISIYRESSILVGNRRVPDIQIIDHLLQFAAPIFRASNTALVYCYIPQTYIKWLAALFAPAGKTGIGMLR